MKRCAQCHGKLGLGVRSRNLWNGRWWIHVRYCSARCEARHELERRERPKYRWYIPSSLGAVSAAAALFVNAPNRGDTELACKNYPRRPSRGVAA